MSQRSNAYDAIIVGAGPGGTTAAIHMVNNGLRVLLLDKATFPRDKICGDAISGKSITVLRRLGLAHTVKAAADSLPVWGVTFSGTNGDEAAIPLTQDQQRPIPPGFVCTRYTFDHLLVEAAQKAGVALWEEAQVVSLLRDEERVIGVRVRRGANEEIAVHAPLVIGADGAYSVVARELGMAQLNEKHYVAGLRAYYENVTGFREGDYMEVHFVEESMPGYFWIFPLPDGRANVGVGMLSAAIKKRQVRLKPLLDQVVHHPRFQDRFAHARRIDKVKGWGLPLGSRPRPMAGAGWMLVGDAASLIDPFSGEGIGNAMISGEQAAQWAVRAHESQHFDAAFLRGYEKEVLQTLRAELRLSHWMQRLLVSRSLLNLVIRKANRSSAIAEAITCMFDDIDERQQLISPMFYLRLLYA